MWIDKKRKHERERKVRWEAVSNPGSSKCKSKCDAWSGRSNHYTMTPWFMIRMKPGLLKTPLTQWPNYVDQTNLFYWSTSWSTVDVDQTELFNWSTSWSTVDAVDAVDVLFYWLFHHALSSCMFFLFWFLNFNLFCKQTLVIKLILGQKTSCLKFFKTSM